jgi:hypothetical protein
VSQLPYPNVEPDQDLFSMTKESLKGLSYENPSGHNAVYRECFIRAGSCGSATVSDKLADTTGELDDFSFSADFKLNLVVARGCVIHGFS